MNFGQCPEAIGDCFSRAGSSWTQASLPLRLSLSIRSREPTAAGNCSGFQVDDEVAAPPDEDGQSHRSEPAVVLEGLELVELEGPSDTSACTRSGEHASMEAPAVQAEQLQSSRDRAAGAVQDAGGLSVGDLGRE